jgi:hypothetical protein
MLALILSFLPWVQQGLPFLLLSPVLSITGLALVIILVVSAVHIAFHIHYINEVNEAKEDLLILYRRYYAYKCAQREDKLRVQRIWSPVRISVQTIRERLNRIQVFIEQARDAMEKQTQQIHRELFDESPTGQRDIFVANGERLQREGKNTLEDFAGQISKKRVKEPVEDWHQSSADIKRQLILQFRQQAQSLMEMSDENAQEQILRFVTNINSAYFKGPLVDLQHALDKENIWLEARDRVETPLYRIDIGKTTREFFFVCGRAWDVNKGQRYLPDDARIVKISDHHEWILLAAFFQGSLPATINPDILFPEKDSADPAGAPMGTPDTDAGTPSTPVDPDAADHNLVI